MKKVAFYTLGCKLNFSETSTISRSFEEKGFRKVNFTDTPDIFVINTCSVTENADKKCKKIVKEAQKINPDGFVAIVGCYAQLKPTEIAEIDGVDAVLGAAEKFRLHELLGTFEKEKSSTTSKAKVFASEIDQKLDYHTSYSLNDRTRTFLKVQDGCDYPCAYCTIPLARGASRSDTVENIVKAAREIASNDIKEIVLTGVNIGDFGLINGERNESFLDLIKTLDEVDGIERFRISSIEPNLLTNEIIEFVAQSKRFVPHFHIPLQSGSNKVLGLMKRRYKRELYQERVTKIKEIMPDCCIGVDVIVGHPGETDELFLETYNFLNDLDVSYLHVFTYSERENTSALSIRPVVPQNKRAERSKMLHILSDKKKRFFYEQHLKTERLVLFETEESNDGKMSGFTDNYIKVTAKFDPLLVNDLKKVKLESINDNLEVDVSEIFLESLIHN
ncbi:MAG: tRNA (N(6)-L-threonylcarbamoyladenosine(37)-C(2))-methylthiotransferase MtaB [Cytophagaceae bacterium]|nr:tRNA (N(6)-L-threonylcarbamoyladenosine(37)-C(2))-methylthiotransferase MtaB [Cytophagaceae bacterium]MBL0327067.1 tRNA (N(6)-L-threonylcarbamoyladenosine(37)-C(2))-methylthiotransferase MtaB [Cytophagaceae bacterium]